MLYLIYYKRRQPCSDNTTVIYPTQMGRYKKLVESYDAKHEFDVIVEYTQVLPQLLACINV